jgi:hypothetical protein
MMIIMMIKTTIKIRITILTAALFNYNDTNDNTDYDNYLYS